LLVLVGLGNPGQRYARNRHNIGFMAVDAVADRHRFGPSRARFHGEIREGSLAGEKVIALKPATYMNESGRSVGEAVRFYKLAPSDIVVFHDEIDLPAGKLRMKAGGGHGGHNGVRSITGHIGDAFRRARLGIGHPGRKEIVSPHVLGDFAKSDAEWIGPLLAALAEHAPALAQGRDDLYGNRVHLALAKSLSDAG
jgi:PTH1 family peptidyl-tRNA hydrolase